MKWLALALWFSAVLPAHADPQIVAPGQVLRGRFEQERHLQGFARPVRSQGSFVVVPGSGLIWRTETPFAMTMVVSPSGVTQSVAGDQTLRLEAARLPFLSRLYAMLGGALTGDWQQLESGFALRRLPGGVVELTPDANDPAARQIAVVTARLGRFVETVEIVKPGGDSDRLRFSEQRIAPGPPDPAEAELLR